MSSTNATIVNSIKGTSTLVRARFGPGMLLHHEDLEQLNDYTRDLSRLLFRSLFGCGVVCGLVVRTDVKCGKVIVSVSPGVALVGSGDPVHVPKAQTLALDEECDGEIPSPLWVILCRTSKCCAPRVPVCPSDEDDSSSSCTREREGFEIRVVSALPECICGCPERSVKKGESDCACVDPEDECYRDHYDGKCGCDDGENCDCCSDCVLLARLNGDDEKWMVSHAARRFVRPVLMRDPEVLRERGEAAARNAEVSFAVRQEKLAREQAAQLVDEEKQKRKTQLVEERERNSAQAKEQQEKGDEEKGEAAKPSKARKRKSPKS